MDKSFSRVAAGFLAMLSLPLVSSADSLVVLGKFKGSSQAFELEFVLDQSAVAVSVDSTALGNLSLEFDAGGQLFIEHSAKGQAAIGAGCSPACLA